MQLMRAEETHCQEADGWLLGVACEWRCSSNGLNLLRSCQCERCHFTSVDMQEMACAQSDISDPFESSFRVSVTLKKPLHGGCYDLMYSRGGRRGFLFESSVNCAAFNLYSHFEVLRLLYAVPLSDDSFCSQLTF